MERDGFHLDSDDMEVKVQKLNYSESSHGTTGYMRPVTGMESPEQPMFACKLLCKRSTSCCESLSKVRETDLVPCVVDIIWPTAFIYRTTEQKHHKCS
jgi:hypothetical protein